MSQRIRNRGSNRNNSSTHGEEAQLWESSRDKIGELITGINSENDNLSKLIDVDKRVARAARDSSSGQPPLAELSQLETLCRNGVRLSEQNSNYIKIIIEQLTVLRGVQHAKEQAADAAAGPGSGPRSSAARGSRSGGGNVEKEREREREREREKENANALYDFDAVGDSPVPSPVGSARKFGDRTSSMPIKRDSTEPPSTALSSSTTMATPPPQSASALAASRSKITFAKGDEVAFKPKAQNGESTDWILGEVAAVLGEGKSRRYKVLDVEPDDQSQQKEHRSSASSMIPITSESQSGGLPAWKPGKEVLALYPNTTTFYKADVISTAPDGKVNLRFEGENDSTTMQQVERRFVIEYRG